MASSLEKNQFSNIMDLWKPEKEVDVTDKNSKNKSSGKNWAIAILSILVVIAIAVATVFIVLWAIGPNKIAPEDDPSDESGESKVILSRYQRQDNPTPTIKPKSFPKIDVSRKLAENRQRVPSQTLPKKPSSYIRSSVERSRKLEEETKANTERNKYIPPSSPAKEEVEEEDAYDGKIEDDYATIAPSTTLSPSLESSIGASLFQPFAPVQKQINKRSLKVFQPMNFESVAAI